MPQSKSIKWKLVTKKVSELKPYSKNPRIFECEVCKKQFTPKYNITKDKILKYCSRECYAKREISQETRNKISKSNTGKIKNPNKMVKSVCQSCGLEFSHSHYTKRKYCSHKCGAKVYAKINGSQKREVVILRNKDPQFIEKVRAGLKKHFKLNPRKNENWYISRYGKDYKPKSSYKISGDWKTISRDIIKEHNYCSRCGKTEKLNVHHIIPYSISKDNSKKNLSVLCKSCHKITEDNNLKIFKIINDWEVLRTLYKTRFEDYGKTCVA